ncbi:MAG: hypothetical protein M3N43_06915 [Actinomycetota bacterium]|nr:hypothetical protein [Actinomycetota bacterium]
MSGDPFDVPARDIPRDRYGRPMVHPPNGGKPVPYTRCTTFVGVLEDTYNLSRWQQRMVALGLADRPDLMLAVAAHRDDRDKLNKITGDALEAAKAGAAATTGTALHALTEKVDRDEPLGVIPNAYIADLEQYRTTTAPLEVQRIEQFRVLDSLRIGGTTDRVVKYGDRYYIADVKTGSIDWGILKICMQLAVYAQSTPYDFETNTRATDPFQVDLERAIVIHLPAGQGRCDLIWADIAAGWQAVQVAKEVRDWRARKGLSEPFEDIDTTFTIENGYLSAAALANDIETLNKVWVDATAAGAWNDELLNACRIRKAQLLEQAA